VLALSPDRRRLAGEAAGSASIYVRPAPRGEGVATLGYHANDIIYRGSWSPNGMLLVTAGYDGFARIWDIEKSRPVRSLNHHKPVTSVAFSPDGNGIATGDWDGTARIWERKTGRLVRTIRGSQAFVGAVSFSRDGRRLAIGSSRYDD